MMSVMAALLLVLTSETKAPTRVDILMVEDMLKRGVFSQLSNEMAAAVRGQLPKPTKTSTLKKTPKKVKKAAKPTKYDNTYYVNAVFAG